MANKKYTKAFVDKYIKDLKMDYRKSKVWKQLDDKKKKEVEQYLQKIEQSKAESVLQKLNLKLPTSKGRNKDNLIESLKNQDNTEGSLLVLEDLQNKGVLPKKLTEYKENKYCDTISRVLCQLNLSSLSSNDKYQNKKIMKTLDFIIKVKFFGSKLEKDIINSIETNLNKEDRELLEQQANALKFKKIEEINYSINKRGIVPLNKNVKNQSLIRNDQYFENINQENWNNYVEDILTFGKEVGLLQYKDNGNEYLITD